MRQTEQDGEHIWLRQSVTFTANGQTRTVEMAIPLRPGAPAEEIERLLAEAEAGMRRLSTRLDHHVAALQQGGTDGAIAAPATPPAPAPSSTTALPAATASEPPHPAAPRPPARPAPAAPSTTPARPAAPAAAARSHPGSPLAPSTPAPSAGSGDLSRKDFLTAATEIGLNAKQAMERLGVRSLEGLDLREALEALRRQMLRDGEVTPERATPASPTPTAPSAPPHYFEEEDDNYDVAFTVDGDDALAEEFGPYEAASSPSATPADSTDELGDLDALEDLDLDDVPDFGPPPSASRAAHPSTPARRGAPAKAAPARPAQPTPAGEESATDESAASSVRQRITQLRAVRGGGAPTTYQRAAYRNVVINELGEPEAAALVRGIWRVGPERLGPEQLDVLISWGKQDTFAEEASGVLSALRAERQQAAAASSEQPPAPTATPRPAPRGRTAQPPRAPASDR